MKNHGQSVQKSDDASHRLDTAFHRGTSCTVLHDAHEEWWQPLRAMVVLLALSMPALT
jgi:hypothetical protein